MNNSELFNSKLEEATEIRTTIQDDYRSKYNELKQMFESFTGEKGKVLKHVTDMYHYRFGGYPNENSEPKHKELIERFAWMVKYFNLIGFSKIYKDELKVLGISIEVDEDFAIPNVPVVEEAWEVLEESSIVRHIKSKEPMFRDIIKAFVLECDEIQGLICGASNVIKKELAPEVHIGCQIKKGDFTSSVMVNYQAQTGRMNKNKVKKLKEKLQSRVETGNFDIDNSTKVIEEEEEK